MTKSSIFFNHSFEKKRLKALISWIHKTFGEKEALRLVDELKATGFINATRAGLSIGLHDLVTPPEKPLLISKAQIAMNKTDQDFKGGKITATERSQRIIDTWHRTSDTLRKQVVDHFNTYDQLNSVYIMALSGARGNFSQVRQLIGMRGLMADPQGQIISFPIRSNFREGLTLTEYFISCSGARKGLVDTALRTADTGYLTRRLVDVSHQVVIKRVACNTSRGIVLKALQTGPVGGSNKTMLPLKDRLIGRVLAEDIKIQNVRFSDSTSSARLITNPFGVADSTTEGRLIKSPEGVVHSTAESRLINKSIQFVQSTAESGLTPKSIRFGQSTTESHLITATSGNSSEARASTRFSMLATRDSEISPNLALKIAGLRDRVIVRSSLTCACINEVCQLCYGWSLSQGKLVSLGEAVGVIAAQSIGEPGTQLTMRTFHTGGVFSGDLLQDIRAPHAGKVFFPEALQGLLVRTAQGQIAFLIKTPGTLLLENGKSQVTRLHLEAATMVFVRQGELIEYNAIIGELAVLTKEGNQPIKSRQTLFAEFGGRVTHHRGRTLKVHKPEQDGEPLSKVIQWYDGKDLDLVKDAEEGIDRLKNGFRFIEPTHSLSLGVFRILATRVGAKESNLSLLQFTGPKLRFSKLHQRSNTQTFACSAKLCRQNLKQPLIVAGTEPRRLALLRKVRARVEKKSRLLSEAEQPTVSLTKSRHARGGFVLDGCSASLSKPTNYWFATVQGDSTSISLASASRAVTKGTPSLQSYALQGQPNFVEPSRAISRRTDLGYGHGLAELCSAAEHSSGKPEWPREARQIPLEILWLPKDIQSGPSLKSHALVGPGLLCNLRPTQGLQSKALQGNKNRILEGLGSSRSFALHASEVDTFRTPSYVLNTIAEEGDLVDENYKECTSSFQFTRPTLQKRTPII